MGEPYVIKNLYDRSENKKNVSCIFKHQTRKQVEFTSPNRIEILIGTKFSQLSGNLSLYVDIYAQSKQCHNRVSLELAVSKVYWKGTRKWIRWKMCRVKCVELGYEWYLTSIRMAWPELNLCKMSHFLVAMYNVCCADRLAHEQCFLLSDTQCHILKQTTTTGHELQYTFVYRWKHKHIWPQQSSQLTYQQSAAQQELYQIYGGDETNCWEFSNINRL